MALRSIVSLRSGWMIALALVLAPAGASALDLTGLLYQEDYQGEVSYPTTPEVDVPGIGGLEVFFGAPTLTGTAVHCVLTDAPGDNRDELTADPATSLGTTSFGLRGRFANVSLGSLGVFAAGVNASFDTASVDFVSGGVRIDANAGTGSVWLFRYSLAFPTLIEEFFALPASAVNAILGGDPFETDLFIDRSANLARATVSVGGQTYGEATLALPSFGAANPLALDQAALHDGPVMTTADMLRFEAFAGVQDPPPVPALGALGLVLTSALLTGLGLRSLRGRRRRGS